MAKKKTSSLLKGWPKPRKPSQTVKNSGVKMKKAPKGWVKASYIKIVRRGGKKVLLVRK